MMATPSRLYLVAARLPDPATHRAWMHEAATAGFNRGACLRLCFWRWWARVQGATAWRTL